MNFSTINLETAGRLLSKKTWVKSLSTQLGPRMWRRLRVALATPLFLASTVAIFMFIGSNEEVLYIYCQRLDSKGLCDLQTGFCRKVGEREKRTVGKAGGGIRVRWKREKNAFKRNDSIRVITKLELNKKLLPFIFRRCRFFVEGVKSGGLFLTAFFMYTIAQCSVSFFKKEEKYLADDIGKTA